LNCSETTQAARDGGLRRLSERLPGASTSERDELNSQWFAMLLFECRHHGAVYSRGRRDQGICQFSSVFRSFWLRLRYGQRRWQGILREKFRVYFRGELRP
jgi:hypothetical protein